MWYSLLAIALFLTAALPVLPWQRGRSRAIGLLHYAVHAVLLAAIVACGVFFVRPDWTPPAVGAAIEPVSIRMAAMLPAGRADLSWLAVGAAVAVAGWVLLAVIDFAYRLSFQTALLQRLLGDIRDSARSLELAIATEGDAAPATKKARAADAKSAIQTMEYVATGNGNGKKRRPLIEMLSG